jgi:two-component system, chemotaxis family, sensor kinase CheA
MNMDDALPAFMAESADLLRQMEIGLLRCSERAPDSEIINLIFRCAHTIKGSAGLFGLDNLVAFVHVIETALDEVRQDKRAMNDALVTLLLQCKDHIAALVASTTSPDVAIEPSLREHGQGLIAALTQTLSAAGRASDGPRPVPAVAPAAVAPARMGAEASADAPACWGISLRFGPDVLKSGMDPLAFIRYLQTFGELVTVKVIEDALPPADQLDPELCYLGFEIEFRTTAERTRIEAAFEFVRDDCILVLTPPRRRATDRAEPQVGSSSGDSGAKVAAQTARVDAGKLDTLITRIGELIAASASADLLAQRSGNSELIECTTALSGLVAQVREGALQLRMVKIGATFNRFQRVVRDVSRELGKEIRLVLHGADTELDKAVIDQIADPLTHLVRNAIDHGIGPPHLRLKKGKPALGTITLNAYHDSGNIVIEVSDDGAGLQRDKILAKAIKHGLVEADRTLTDSEIFNLVFEPGFSTKDSVTNLSGRGVGMDVVKRNIAALRGSVAIKSEEGIGTTISVRLPLTLAIINGFNVGIGITTFVLPLDAVDECIEFTSESNQDFTNLRGTVLPFVRLRELFGCLGPPGRRQSIVVVRHANQRAGLVVDRLIGESQTVIKPLGKLIGKPDYAAGSSILGNGEVALILDVPALIGRAMTHARTRGRMDIAPAFTASP